MQSPPVLALTTIFSPLDGSLAEDRDPRLRGRSIGVVGSIGEAGDEEVEVFGGLLTVACAGVGVFGVGEESRLRRRVAVAEVFGRVRCRRRCRAAGVGSGTA